MNESVFSSQSAGLLTCPKASPTSCAVSKVLAIRGYDQGARASASRNSFQLCPQLPALASQVTPEPSAPALLNLTHWGLCPTNHFRTLTAEGWGVFSCLAHLCRKG